MGSFASEGEKCVGTTLLSGVRIATFGMEGAAALDRVLAEPEGTLVALCCARGGLGLAGDGASAFLRCGEVLSFVTGEGAPAVLPTAEPVSGVALLVFPASVASGTAAALAGFDVDAGELARLTARHGHHVDAAGSPVSRALMDLAVSVRTENVAALKLRCIEALRCLCEARMGAPEAPVRADRPAIARAACDLMRSNVEHPLTIDELARRCATSPTVLKESFRAEFGVPVHEWYRRYRMLRAADLLGAGAGSVSDVARAVGYSNASKFAQAFSACMGATPSAWRRRAMTFRPDGERVRLES